MIWSLLWMEKCILSKAVSYTHLIWIDYKDILDRAQIISREITEKEASVINDRKYLDKLFTAGFYLINAESKLDKIKKLEEIIKACLLYTSRCV